MREDRNFYINGRWVAPIDGCEHLVVNPSTEEVDAVISLGGREDTNSAVAAARAAFPEWMNTPPSERISLVERLKDEYEKRADELATVISLEMGAPIDMARTQQVGTGVSHLQSFINVAKNFQFDRPLGNHAPEDRVVYEPIGVCALITPWNWPMNQICLKVVAAAIAGCTMVLKPSEESPLSGIVFANAMHAAGFPPGVFNLVNGDGAGVGTYLSNHSDIDMVSFTGSTRAGILISKAAADSLKRVTLELGGKGANIVFNDADDDAISRGVLHCMNNTGQSCNAPTRMLVQRDLYEKAVSTAAEVAQSVHVGLAHEAGGHLGPVVNEKQYNKIQGLIKAGIDEGARIVAGGIGRPDGLSRGFFVRPTVFADVNSQMTIAREEIFGPVLSIQAFDTEEEAVEIANDTDYGLTNYIQTQDSERGKRVAGQLRSGMVVLNGRPRGLGAPFGGMKQSGNGREGGMWGLEDFLEVKSISGWPT